METVGAPMNSKNSLNLIQDDSRKASILAITVNTLGGGTKQIKVIIYTLFPEIFKALSSTSYTGKFMKNEKVTSMMNIIKNGLNYTGVGDKSSRKKSFSTITFPKLVIVIRNKTFDKIIHNSDNLQGEGAKIFIPSNIFDDYIRFQVLLGL